MEVGQVKRRLLEAMLMLAPGLYGRWASARSAGPVSMPALPAGPHRVLLVDHDFPEVDRDAGSRAIASFASLLTDAGLQVVFWAATTAPSAAGRLRVQKLGIAALSQQDSGALETWLAKAGGDFIAAVLSRPLVAAMYLPVVRRHIAGPCIYYGHDIHHQRLQSMHAVSVATAADRWQRLMMQVVERRLWRAADVVLYPSIMEAAAANGYRNNRGLAANAEMFPLWTVDARQLSRPAAEEQRSGLLFVGSLGHAPNVDGLDWFLREVLPLLPHARSEHPLTIVGSGMEDYRPPAQARAAVRILGRVDDATLDQCYASARLVIAPLRFGGGVKGKVLEAIGQGVPCVMTSAAAQGLDGIEDILPVTDDPRRYAAAIQMLLQDRQAWRAAACDARMFLAERYDHDRFVRRLQQLLLPAPGPGRAGRAG